MRLSFPHPGSHRFLSFCNFRCITGVRGGHAFALLLPSLSASPLGPVVLKGAIYAAIDWLVCVSRASQCEAFVLGARLASVSQFKLETHRCVAGSILAKRVKESCVSSLFTFGSVYSVKWIKSVWDTMFPGEYRSERCGYLSQRSQFKVLQRSEKGFEDDWLWI